MTAPTVFADRYDAGRRLAERLASFADQDVVVCGLPRGGVPVAFEVARALGAPLDVILARKVGVPYQPELAMGAIGEDDVRVVNNAVVEATRVTPEEYAYVEARERAEIERRARTYRGDRPRESLEGRVVIVVDDGIATGSTARAACRVARAHGAARVVLAAPVAPEGFTERVGADADDVVILQTPVAFSAVGQFYRDFTQTTDREVRILLEHGAVRHEPKAAASVDDDPPPRDEEVEIPVEGVRLGGHVTIPWPVRGIVVFAHGSGSSRHSPRNRFVAEQLGRAGLGTVLFDLLTTSEEPDRANVFDIELLAQRLAAVTDWVAATPEAKGQPIGYFGASTGAGAALWAAADRRDIGAVVSRGGRPDLAAHRLPAVRAPTLLIVGGRDEVVIDLNRQAQSLLRCPNQLEIVAGATHLCQEPGALERVAELAARWFTSYLA